MIVAADDGILATLNVGEPAFDSYLGKAGRATSKKFNVVVVKINPQP
jgi:hypothetical protein